MRPWSVCLGVALLLSMQAGAALGREIQRSQRSAPRSGQASARGRRVPRAPAQSSLVILPALPDTQLTPPRALTAPSSPPDQEVDFLTRRERRLRRIAPRQSLVYLDASVGAAYLRARRLDFDRGIVQTNELAMGFRASAGLRVEFLTLGVFLTHARFVDAPLSTGGIEVGLRVPLGRFEPSLRTMFGYAWEGGPAERNRAEIGGFTLGGTLGLALFLQRHLSVELAFDTAIIAVAARALDLSAVDQEHVDEARRKLERTSLARLNTLRLALGGHF
jgi:hypothetical protein